MSSSFDFTDPLQLLASCSEIFGHPALSHESTVVYFSSIGMHDKEPLAAALRHWLRNEHRFPLPADIRKVIGHVQQPYM